MRLCEIGEDKIQLCVIDEGKISYLGYIFFYFFGYIYQNRVLFFFIYCNFWYFIMFFDSFYGNGFYKILFSYCQDIRVFVRYFFRCRFQIICFKVDVYFFKINIYN